jgi:hypothetical protein
MAKASFAHWMLEQEARSLLTRLARVRPFALKETMVPAANLLPAAQVAIEEFLMGGRGQLRRLVDEFIVWLRSGEGALAPAEEAQRRFTLLRLRFNGVLTQFDTFNDVITQRSENETGVWLSGLDVLAADALRLELKFFTPPPVICYLDRGAGAAIRRARTRLPGGGASPVAIIKVPRERMVGSGIASSLIHEVGHQGAALLGLVVSLARGMRSAAGPSDAGAWQLWERWISEIVADFWSVARVGLGSTMGLMSVVSLPRAFVFRISADDPHPTPWIRVKLSAAIGDALYPQPLWGILSRLWESYYPLAGLHPDQQETLAALERTIPPMVALLAGHRAETLKGISLAEALRIEELHPENLREMLQRWRRSPAEMYTVRPTVVLAAIGQGRAEGAISPEEESIVLGKLLTDWALRSTLEAAAGCGSGLGRLLSGNSEGGTGMENGIRRTSWQTH